MIGNGEAEERPAARPALGPDAAAVRRDDAAADGEPQAHARARRAAGALELVEDALLLPGGQARTAVGDRRRSLRRSPASAMMSIGVPGGVCFDGVLQQVDEDLLQQDLVHRDQRQVGGKSVVTRRPSSCSSVRMSATPATSERGCHSRCTSRAPVSTRTMSSRFATSRFMRWDSCTMVPASSRRAPASLGPSDLQQRGPRSLDRGQRGPKIVRQGAEQRGSGAARPRPRPRSGGSARPGSGARRPRPPARRGPPAAGAGRDRGTGAAP